MLMLQAAAAASLAEAGPWLIAMGNGALSLCRLLPSNAGGEGQALKPSLGFLRRLYARTSVACFHMLKNIQQVMLTTHEG